MVRGSSRCDDIRPIKEGYGSAGKGANDDHDLAGNAGARHLWSYSVARSQRVRVRQRRSPAFQRGLRVALIVCSNALNFSVAIITFALTGPIPLFSCSAADANQRHLSAIDLGAYRRRSIWTRSSNITIELERSLARTNHFLVPVFALGCRTGAAG